MHQHSVESSHAEGRSRDGDDAAPSPDQPQLRRMVAVPGLAVPRRPAGAADPPPIRRTLVDNAGHAPVVVSTLNQLQAYPWWTSLTQPQQDHLETMLDAEYVDQGGGPVDLQQALASVPRRAVTGGVDFVNEDSWGLIVELVDQYTDVVCADPALNLPRLGAFRTQNQQLDFGAVQQVIQQAAPGARNADIFIIHPGPWITTVNSLHTDLQAVMTRGCVAYVLTDNEGGSGGQAATLQQGLTQLGGFNVTVQTLVPDPQGMVTLMTGPQNRAIQLKPYHLGGFRLIRIVA